MGRKPGARNQNHEAVRSQLATSIGMQLLTAGGRQPSLRALAEGAEVDPGTLRHYFGTREGAIQAAFDQLSSMGGDQMARGRALAALPAREAFKTLLTRIAEAWQGPLGSMHAAGFGEGMASTGVGQTYIRDILEPTLSVVEELLTTFAQRGEIHVIDTRVSGLALMSPVLLALFHQHQLSGATCRPLDVNAFIDLHLDTFFAGHLTFKTMERT